MAQPLGQTGTSDSITAEYLNWEAAGGRFVVHMHREAIDGLARDVIERSEGLPVEVGGLLLGHAGRGERPVVWIERYQRIDCEHRAGPHFILDEKDHRTLERAASERSGDLSVVGIYRSHIRPGFQLEPPDFELTDRYFKDPEDLFLLIGQKAPGELLGQFFLHERVDGDSSGEVRAADPPFPFQGSVAEDPAERTGRSAVLAPETPVRRRLVPDFAPAMPPSPESLPEPSRLSPTEDLGHSESFLRRRGPVLAALLLVAACVAVFVQQASHHDSAAVTPASVPNTETRPLGLYVDSAAETWRISWNPSATALQGERGVKLFVREGEDQQLIELTPKDLESGTYQYQAPKGQDVTFRLEVKNALGNISAESFRLLRVAEPKSTAAGPAVSPAPPPAAPPAQPVARRKAIHKVAPVVPAGIRPRIRRTIPVDVRVRIDAQGRVVSATPVTRAHSAIETLLTGRAVEAARQWRFEPAAAATEIIHFSFEK
jgi:proteasome lid subunit RPN8/RPN11